MSAGGTKEVVNAYKALSRPHTTNLGEEKGKMRKSLEKEGEKKKVDEQDRHNGRRPPPLRQDKPDCF